MIFARISSEEDEEQLYHFQIQMHLFLESARGLKGFSLAHESGDTTC